MNEFKGFEDMHDLPEAGAPLDDGKENAVLFVEDCSKCGGSGNWRPGYKCFKCKGKGKLEFKTSASQRRQGRRSAAKAKVKKADENLATWLDWLEQHGVVKDWLTLNCQSGNTFAQSLYQGGIKYGHLTEGQEQAVYKAIARDDDGRLGFEAWCEDHEGVLAWLKSEIETGNEFAGSLMAAGIRYGALTDNQLNAVLNNVAKDVPVPKGSELDLSPLKGYYAVPDGDTRLKLCVRRPGKNSRWFGWTFVDDGAAYGNRKTYGKQGPDGTYQGAVQDSLQAILDNPYEAQIAYGKLTGTCGVCGRLLEDEESVAAGIGPICASRLAG